MMNLFVEVGNRNEGIVSLSYGDPGYDIKKVEQERRYRATVTFDVYGVNENVGGTSLAKIYITSYDPAVVAAFVPGKKMLLTVHEGVKFADITVMDTPTHSDGSGI